MSGITRNVTGVKELDTQTMSATIKKETTGQCLSVPTSLFHGTLSTHSTKIKGKNCQLNSFE